MNANNNNTTTQKQLNDIAKWYNQEYSNIYGCLRAMLCDNAPKEAKEVLRKIGLKSRKDVDNVAKLVIENQPIIARTTDNEVIPMERVKKRATTTTETIERPITKWTFRKILNCVRVLEGAKAQITL